MIYYEGLLAILVFFCTIPVWFYLYKNYLGDILAEIYVEKIESGKIDLNYLLDEGGVFDELSERIITRFKQNMLADMGQLSNQSKSSSGNEGLSVMGDQAAMGIEAAGELLRMVGMRKPPAMLQYKVANALGKMLEQQTTTGDDDSVGRFYPDRP